MGKNTFSEISKRFVLPLLLLFTISCSQPDEDVISVDFSNIALDTAKSHLAASVNPLKVAVAAIVSPSESFIYYQVLFDYISHKINKPILFVQRKTYSEINAMLASRQVDIAFICSGAFVINKEYCDLFVVPVCNGLPYYQAYIIVNANSTVSSFAELEGKTFAFSDPLSNTGKLYPEYRLKELFNKTSTDFFSKTLFSNAHDISIQLVSKNIVDGASVDGLIYEYLLKNSPAKVENIKIIEKSEYLGIPPVVCSKWIDNDLKIKLKEIFLTINNDTAGNKILSKLMIDKFIVASDTLYNKVAFMSSIVR